MPVSYRDGSWSFRKIVTLPNGTKTRVSGRGMSTKLEAEQCECEAIARVIRHGSVIGRPPAAGETRDHLVATKATKAERLAWQRAADKDGVTLGEWIRECANHAAARRAK